jgi:hypothetical protein
MKGNLNSCYSEDDFAVRKKAYALRLPVVWGLNKRGPQYQHQRASPIQLSIIPTASASDTYQNRVK